MHEFSIAQSLLDVARETAVEAGVDRVCSLNCRVGVLRQVDDELLREAFSIAAADTLCAGATLVIEKCRMQAYCPRCASMFDIVDWDWTCRGCGGEGESPHGGDELELTSIEAESPE